MCGRLTRRSRFSAPGACCASDGSGRHDSGADDAYARGALDRECAELAHASAGRNEQLNKAAFALGQFVGADRLTQGEVERALFDAAVANGYVAKDGPAAALATIKSGIERARSSRASTAPSCESLRRFRATVTLRRFP